MNLVSLAGIVFREPKIIFERDQHKKITFTMSCQKLNGGADYITLVAYDKTADIILKWCKRGKFLSTLGRIESYKYQDKSTQETVYKKDIVIDKVLFYDYIPLITSTAPEEKEPATSSPTGSKK